MTGNPYKDLVKDNPKKGILKCLDGDLITTRTGKKEIKGEFSIPPLNYQDFIFIYDPKEIMDSSGVRVACDLVENIDNVFRIIDANGRRFELEVL